MTLKVPLAFSPVRKRAVAAAWSVEDYLAQSINALLIAAKAPGAAQPGRERSLSGEIAGIEEDLYATIALMQPLPSDMPHLSSTICLLTSLERIACYAGDIAAVSLPSGSGIWLLPRYGIPEMAEETLSMVHDAIAAFEALSPQPISSHPARNDQVKQMGIRALTVGLEDISNDPRDIRRVEQVFLVVRALEASAANAAIVAENLEAVLRNNTPGD